MPKTLVKSRLALSIALINFPEPVISSQKAIRLIRHDQPLVNAQKLLPVTFSSISCMEMVLKMIHCITSLRTEVRLTSLRFPKTSSLTFLKLGWTYVFSQSSGTTSAVSMFPFHKTPCPTELWAHIFISLPFATNILTEFLSAALHIPNFNAS